MACPLHSNSEIAPLKTVLLHRPGSELLNLYPDNLSELLFDDIPYLADAQKEHDAFAGILKDHGVEVLYLCDLAAESLQTSPQVKAAFCERYVQECELSSEYSIAAVKDYLAQISDARKLIDTCIEGIKYSDLGLSGAGAASLTDYLSSKSAFHQPFVADPIPNLYFTRDTFSVIGSGVSMNSMRFKTRRRESIFGDMIFAHHPRFKDVPIWHKAESQAHLEGGDILVLSPSVIMMAISERTQSSGVDELARGLFWGPVASDIREIYVCAIPARRSFMHFDTVCTQLDVDAFLIHPQILDTLSIFKIIPGNKAPELKVSQIDKSLDQVLADICGLDAVRLITCGGSDAIAGMREQWNDGSNTLAIAPGKVCVYERNNITNEILYHEGIELFELPSAELSRGRGGPHCMSMALVRL